MQKKNLVIANQYKTEAKNIHDEYVATVTKLTEEEAALSKYKEGLEGVIKDLSSKSQADLSAISMEDVERLLVRLDRDHSVMRARMRPYVEKVEQLERRATALYDTLKERYPGHSDAELALALQQ